MDKQLFSVIFRVKCSKDLRFFTAQHISVIRAASFEPDARHKAKRNI